mgnify:FL=1
MTQRVLVDANVLASRILTDWLFHLRKCNRGMFSILWTRDIQAEAIRAMRKKHPGWSGSAIERRFEMMEALIDDSVVAPDGDYGFSGADPGDFHVHAAAVEGNVHYVLTDNRPEDFTSHPDEEPYEIVNSDDFFNLVADSNQPGFVAAVAGQFEYYSRPGVVKDPLHVALQRAGCPNFAKRVKLALGQIALQQ